MEENVQIKRLSYGSSGITQASDGKTIFVKNSVPGDNAHVILDEDKGSFYRGHISELVKPSPDRVQSSCPFFGTCGGCTWQHIHYEAQLKAKRANVVDALVRTAHMQSERAESLVRSCKGSKREFGYRNKLELSAGFSAQNEFTLGLTKEGSHEIVPVTTCPLAHKTVEKTPKAVQGALRYIQGGQDLGVFRVGIRHSLRTGDLEIALWTKPSSFPRKIAAQTLKNTCKATSIVRVMAKPGKQRAIKGIEVLEGKGYWEEKMRGFTFRASAPSFFQVNTAQAETLIDEVIGGLSLTESSVVADLYAGSGTFSIPLAEHAGTVFAVESASSSVQDLRVNTESNDVFVEVIGGDSARELPGLGHLDALVVDPPRAGLADGVVGLIAAAKPERVAYVSCNPSTWARDVALFEKEGYTLTHVQPVDLFPQTYHVEIVSFFLR